jgi:hypothetical protein
MWSFGPSAANRDNRVLVSAFDDALLELGSSFTTLLFFDGAAMRVAGELDDLVRCIQPYEDGFVAVTEDGLISTFVPEQHLNTINLGDNSVVRGPIRACQVIGNLVVVVGTNSTCFAVTPSTGMVEDYSSGLGSDVPLTGIAFDPGVGLIAVGLDGSIWHRHDDHWIDAGSPADRLLTCVCAVGDGQFLVAGQHGFAAMGAPGSWKRLELGVTFDISAVAQVDTTSYLSGISGLLQRDGASGEVTVPEFGSEAPTSFSFVFAAPDSVVWSVGPKDLWARTASGWRSLFG